MATYQHIQGMDQLAKFFRTYPAGVANKAARKSAAIPAALLRERAKEIAPYYHGDVSQGQPAPGTLKKAISIKRITGLPLTRIVYIVFVRSGKSRQSVGKKQRNLDAYYWRFVEFGTSKMGARPFMRPAFESSKDEALILQAENLRIGALNLVKEYGWGQLG